MPGRTRIFPKACTCGGRPLKAAALVRKIITPKKMLMLASVMMKL